MRFIIITGMSGAGKATALHYFGDIGYFAVDNLPPRLLPALASSCRDSEIDRLLAVVDARAGGSLSELPAMLDQLAAQGNPANLLLLDASDDVLVRRFKETRRPHPLFGSGKSVLEAVQAERRMVDEIRGSADRIIDSSGLSPAELCRVLADSTSEQPGLRLHITVQSFGFKHGLPVDSDLVFDVRFLANPHYVPKLKPLTGLAPEVARYVHGDPLTEPFLERLYDLIQFSLPQYQREGKAYLTIAIGCTGGRHRSVTVGEDLAKYLRREGYRVSVLHRDVHRESVSDSGDGRMSGMTERTGIPASGGPTS